MVLDPSMLHKQATAAKKAGDLSRAVLLLQQAQALMQYGHPIDTWLRLPVFMQQAGQYDASLVEFDRLIQMVSAHDGRLIYSAGPYGVKHQAAVMLSHIYDKMRLVHQRQGKPDAAKAAAALRSKQQDIIEMLEPLLKREQTASRRLPKTQ